jgi:CRP/FNR family transcriptional regulator, cyclic AMP receptor protein
MSQSKKSRGIASAGPVDWTGIRTECSEYASATTIFSQGDDARSVMYVQEGTVRLSVLSHAGKEAVVAVLNGGHFFGEGCLAGQTRRMATASAIDRSTVIIVDKDEMVRQLHARPAFARTLLLLARYGEPGATHRVLPKLSQETLAEMVGTTRSRINFFMNKFRKLGLIEYNGELKINNSLLSVVLRD